MQVKRSSQSGDTIIEVMLAFAVTAMIAASILTIMRMGVGVAQRSLEITQVRQQMDSQAEMLRFIQKAYIQQFDGRKSDNAIMPDTIAYRWIQLREKGNNSTLDTEQLGPNGRCRQNRPDNSFYLTNNATISTANIILDPNENKSTKPYAWIDNTTSYGMYIQAKSSTINNTRYIDFVISACWDSSGNAAPVTLSTIVRLYEPRP